MTLRWFAGRVLQGIITLLVISFVAFLATNIVPSDPARTALGRQATEKQLDLFREEQGLDRPPLERYATWLGGAMTTDFGTSTLTRHPVTEETSVRLPRTLLLCSLAALIAIPAALAAGLYTGQRSGKPSDVAISTTTILLNSLPEFVIGISLLTVFAAWLGLLPVESSGVVFGDFAGQVKAYVLPVACLTLVLFPYITRIVRANTRDTLSRPFIRSVVLRGVPRRRVVNRHLTPNAVIPSINVVTLSLAEVLSGIVVIETVFGFPGIGKELVDSVLGKDIPVVQALTLIMGGAFIVLNLAADALQLRLDPRLRTRPAHD